MGFEVLYRNERKSRSGGVLIACRPQHKPHIKLLLDQVFSEQIYISVYNSFVLGAVYIPPRNSNYFSAIDRFLELQKGISLATSLGMKYIVVGDLNSRFGNRTQRFCFDDGQYDEFPIANADHVLNTSGRELLQLCNDTHSVIATGRLWDKFYTCYQDNGTSVVDTGLCSIDMLGLISNGKLHDLSSLSDHSGISFDIDIDLVPIDEDTTRDAVLSKSRIRSILKNPEKCSRILKEIQSHHKYKSLMDRIDSVFNSGICLSKSEVSNVVERLYSTFRDLLNMHCATNPKRPHRHNQKVEKGCCTVFFDKQYLEARRLYYLARRVFRKDSSKGNYHIFKKRKRVKNSNYRRCERLSRIKYVNMLFESCNSKNLWNMISPKLRGSYNGPISVVQFSEYLEDIAQGKFSFDEELSAQATQMLIASDVMSVLPSSVERDLHESFPYSTVLKPKLGKAVGIDGWSGELVRFLACPLFRLIPKLFLICLRSGVTPTQWDQDIKIPVPKPGRPLNVVKNLRPITLVNTPMKQFELWILSILKSHYRTSEYQAGFKENYSCAMRLFVLKNLVDMHLHSYRSSFIAVFVDFSCFFDTVHEELLCQHFLEHNVPGYLVRVLHNMLSSVSARVFMKGEYGHNFKCPVGLRQGSCLSPFLATAFLDKISDFLDEQYKGIRFGDEFVTHLFYADDFVMFFKSHNEAQVVLNSLAGFCKKIGLNVNAEKTFWTFFSNRKPRGIPNLVWEGKVLESFDEALYLGGPLKSNGSLDAILEKGTRKANRAFSLLLSFQKRFPEMSFSRFVQLYHSLVFPSLTYASEISCWSLAEKYNKVFVQHLRRYFGIPKSVSEMALLWMTGLRPLHVKLWKFGYKFWHKIASLDKSRLELKALLYTKTLLNGKTWFDRMTNCFSEIGFHGEFHEWTPDEILTNKPRFLENLEKHFLKRFTDWVSASSYTFLVNTHLNWVQIPFLDFADFENRRLLSRLFLRVFNFESTTGTRHNQPKSLRFCQYCVERCSCIVGDEVHYLQNCPKFSLGRNIVCNTLRIDREDIVLRISHPHTSRDCNIIARFCKEFVRLPDPFQP